MDNRRGYKDLVTSHYMAYWGVPKDIKRIAVKGYNQGVGVMLFSDADDGGVWCATNGVYDIDWPNGKGGFFGLELVVYVKSPQYEHVGVDLLTRMCDYMVQHQVPMMVWETIAGGSWLRDHGLPFDDLLVLEPFRADSGLGGRRGRLPKTLLINQLTGIHKSERQYAVQYGAENLFERIVDHGFDERLPIDVPRAPPPATDQGTLAPQGN